MTGLTSNPSKNPEKVFPAQVPQKVHRTLVTLGQWGFIPQTEDIIYDKTLGRGAFIYLLQAPRVLPVKLNELVATVQGTGEKLQSSYMYESAKTLWVFVPFGISSKNGEIFL